MRRATVIGAAVLAATPLLAGALAVSAASPGPDSPPPVAACLSRAGDLRAVVVGARPSRPCRADETAIAWNLLGATGAPGLRGDAGLAGAPGQGRIGAESLVWFDDFESGVERWSCTGPHGRACTGTGDTPPGDRGMVVGPGWAIHTSVPLPPHEHVRIRASVHWSDRWQGETVRMTVDGATVWSDSHHHCTNIFSGSCAGISTFGDEVHSDRLGVLIDVVVPHDAPEVSIAFSSGSTRLEPPAGLVVDDVGVSIS